MNKETILKSYLNDKGIALKELGIASKGLNRDNALDFIDLLHSLSIPVLGGDVVCIDENGNMKLSYDNWYCNKMNSETDLQYSERSQKVAKQYIVQYHNSSLDCCSFLFDLVLKYQD